MQPNPSPTLPISTQAASIGAMIVGALGAILTVLGVSLTTVSALQSIAQLLISAALIIAGLMAHTHLHSQQLTAQSANASVAPGITIPTPPATDVVSAT